MRVAVLTPEGEGQIGVSFADALSREGHDAHVVPARALTGGSRKLILARRLRLDRTLSAVLRRPLDRTLADLEPELTIVVKGRFLSAPDVESLRRASGGAVVNYFPDNPFYPAFHEAAVVEALAAYDSVFIWSQELVEQLRMAGVASAVHLPFGYDDEIYRPGGGSGPSDWDAGFVGQWSELRERHLRPLTGLRVVVAGPGWEGRLRRESWCTVIGGSPHGSPAADIYRRSAVGLNILHPQNTGAHNMRTWELPATGTACAMTASPFHAGLFGEAGIAAFEGPDDIRAAVDGLLEDEQHRRAVAAAGQAAVRPGTYRARMTELLASLPP